MAYCANCGMRLPDWAHFCERCGSPLPKHGMPADPIEQVGLDDTSAEPLWFDPEAPQDEDTDVREDALDAMTKPMTMSDGEPSDEEPEKSDNLTVAMSYDDEADGSDTEGESDEGSADDADEANGAETEPTGNEEPEAEGRPAPDETPEPEPSAEGSPDPRIPLQTIRTGYDEEFADGEWHRPTDTWSGSSRPYRTHDDGSRSMLPMVVVSLVAAVCVGLLVARFLFGVGAPVVNEAGEEVARSKRVPKKEANALILGLDGWWKTGRTYDGRYWHLQGGLMEIFAADGKLASQVLLDPASVERMETGPGGIEGAGYYFRDVAYYLVDGDTDTLHAIAQDGQADEDANLLRTEAPSYVSEGTSEQKPEPVETADESEYILPESATRIYEAWELADLSDHDLFLARNEIYARHGYVFETGELSSYFSSKSWYQPSEVFNEGEISEIERQNVSTILSLEQSRGSRYV